MAWLSKLHLAASGRRPIQSGSDMIFSSVISFELLASPIDLAVFALACCNSALGGGLTVAAGLGAA